MVAKAVVVVAEAKVIYEYEIEIGDLSHEDL